MNTGRMGMVLHPYGDRPPGNETDEEEDPDNEKESQSFKCPQENCRGFRNIGSCHGIRSPGSQLFPYLSCIRLT